MGTWRGEEIIIYRQVDDFALAYMGGNILKYPLSELGLKVRIVV